MSSVLTTEPNNAKIKHRTEPLTIAEWQLLARIRMLSNAMILLTINVDGQPIGWTVLTKFERPSVRTE